MAVCKEMTLRIQTTVLSCGLAVLAAHVIPGMLAMAAEPMRSASQQAPAAATDGNLLDEGIS